MTKKAEIQPSQYESCALCPGSRNFPSEVIFLLNVKNPAGILIAKLNFRTTQKYRQM